MPPAGAAGVNEVCRRPPRILHSVARIRCARRHPEKSPGGAALTGATGACGRIARLSVAPAGAIPRWRCAYRGYRACGRIARLSVAPAGEIPGGAALTGATGRRSGCPAKRRASRRNPRWRCAYRGYRGVRSDCPAKRRASRGDPGQRVTPPARTAA